MEYLSMHSLGPFLWLPPAAVPEASMSIAPWQEVRACMHASQVLQVVKGSSPLTGTPRSAACLMACSTAGVSSCFEFSSVPSTSVAMSLMRGRSAEHMHLWNVRPEGATRDAREGLLKVLVPLPVSPPQPTIPGSL